MLVEHHALAILTEFDSERQPKAISFRVQTEHGLLSFQLPARIDGVTKILLAGRRRYNAQPIRQQGRRDRLEGAAGLD